jgi:signal recognition particle subunit SRP54
MALFESLSGRLRETVRKLKGMGRVTEKDVSNIMRDIKLALLEADVNFKVVREFIKKVSERAVGQDVLESLTPGQQVIKIVHEELINLLGSTPEKISFSSKPPTIILMAGLQGSGKTTSCGKLANLIRKQGKNPLLAACDIYRPAAVKQLEIIGNQLKIPVFSISDEKNVVNIAKSAVEHAKNEMYDTLIIDTAGRLHIDDLLMKELENIKDALKPDEILLVVDSMTGQDAVNAALKFNEVLGINGIIMTKLDSDTRGGASLSVKAVTGSPIKFAGIGEKLNDLEPFYPDRIASRILGMGDVLSLIEKAQDSFDEKKALELEKKIRTQQFTLDDFLEQMEQLKNMGPLDQVLSMIPGMDNKMLKNADIDENKMKRNEAIIRSMTIKERNEPSIINSSRKKRISSGSGVTIQDVNRLLKDFEQVRKMFKIMSDTGKHGKKAFPGFKMPF